MILDRIMAATPDNPRFSLNDPQAWDVFLGGQPAASGVRVTRETALTYAPWWRAINVIANDVQKLPLEIFKVTATGKKRDPSHQAWPMLRRKANEFTMASTFKHLLTAHALQTGNGYAYIERSGDAAPVALLQLDPEQVTPCREGGKLVYIVNVNGENRKLQAWEIFHIKGFSPDGLIGYSVYFKAMESIGLGLGARKYGSVFFRNNARPNIAIEVPRILNDKQRQELVKGWNATKGGLEEAHKVAVLAGGAKLTPFTINAKDSQLLETRQFENREIALWVGIPPHKVGDSSKASYNSLEQENKDYLDSGLDPWLVRWEDESWDKLMTEADKRTEAYEARFNRKMLVRANMNDRSNYYQKATGNKAWMLVDEVREEEDLELLGGDAAQLQPATPPQPPQPGTPPQTPSKPEDDQPTGKKPGPSSDAIRAVVEDAAGRMVRRIGRTVDAAARTPAGFVEFIETIAGKHREVVTEAMTPSALLVDCRLVEMTDYLLELIRCAYLDAAGEATAAKLEQVVTERTRSIETSIPREVAEVFIAE